MKKSKLHIRHIPDKRLRLMASRQLSDGQISVLVMFVNEVLHLLQCRYCVGRFGFMKRRTIAQARRVQGRH